VLNGLVSLSDNNEEDIVNQFGTDAGLAFWLLGELNRLVNRLAVLSVIIVGLGCPMCLMKL